MNDVNICMLPNKTAFIICMLQVDARSFISLHGHVKLLSVNDVCPYPGVMCAKHTPSPNLESVH